MDLETMKCEFPHILAEFEKEIIQRWQEEKSTETEPEPEPATEKDEPATVQSIFFREIKAALKEKPEEETKETCARDQVTRILQERFQTRA